LFAFPPRLNARLCSVCSGHRKVPSWFLPRPVSRPLLFWLQFSLRLSSRQECRPSCRTQSRDHGNLTALRIPYSCTTPAFPLYFFGVLYTAPLASICSAISNIFCTLFQFLPVHCVFNSRSTAAHFIFGRAMPFGK